MSISVKGKVFSLKYIYFQKIGNDYENESPICSTRKIYFLVVYFRSDLSYFFSIFLGAVFLISSQTYGSYLNGPFFFSTCGSHLDGSLASYDVMPI